MPFLILLILLTASPWGIAEPSPFRAEYVAEFQGLPVKAKGTRALEKLGEDTYRFSSSADSFMVKVLEYSEFRWSDGRLIPQHYQYERKGIGRNRFEASRFDWQNQLVSHDESSSPLMPDTLDKLSYQYQLRMDVARAMDAGDTDQLLAYTIADEEKRKQYVFRITAEQTLTTPLGDLATVRVDRIMQDPEDADRSTSMWLSTAHDYVLVKLRITEGDRGFELNISAFEDLAGAPDAALGD